MRRHVYYFTLLDGHDIAAGLLRGDPQGWLPAPATRTGQGWEVRLTAAGVLPPPLAEHLAVVEVDQRASADSVVRPLTWRSAGVDRLLPVLEGELELARLDGDAAHLSLLGSYRPPLSVAGEMGDRLIGHRVAEACVRRFVLDVAARLGRVAPVGG